MFLWLILVTFWGASSAPNKLCFQKLLRLIFLKFPAAPRKLDCVRRERSAATCCRVVSADKKVECRSVLIANNFFNLRCSSNSDFLWIILQGGPIILQHFLRSEVKILFPQLEIGLDLWPNVGVIEQNYGFPTGFASRENSDSEC
jgi:hypothetical protein